MELLIIVLINQVLIILDIISRMLNQTPTALDYSKLICSCAAVLAAVTAILTSKIRIRQEHSQRMLLEHEIQGVTDRLKASDALNIELLEANLHHQRRIEAERWTPTRTKSRKTRRRLKPNRGRNSGTYGKLSEIESTSYSATRNSEAAEIFL